MARSKWTRTLFGVFITVTTVLTISYYNYDFQQSWKICTTSECTVRSLETSERNSGNSKNRSHSSRNSTETTTTANITVTTTAGIPKETTQASVSNRTQFTEDDNEITIVTLYTTIADFQKGFGNSRFTSKMYHDWMTSWGWLTNRVIAFFDKDETINHFREIRSSQPPEMTSIIKINQSELPAFLNVDKIRQIFQKPNYPRFPPNTVVPEYACAMSAKYDVLQRVINEKIVKTRYLAWLDIGYFRLLMDPKFHTKGENFSLDLPEGFNSNCIGMSEVSPRESVSKMTPWTFISTNTVWVAGGFLVATIEKIKIFAESYISMSDELLRQNITSTDQQIIGAMYSPDYISRQKVAIISYRCKSGQFGLTDPSDVQFFCFGFTSKQAGDIKHGRNITSITNVTATITKGGLA